MSKYGKRRFKWTFDIFNIWLLQSSLCIFTPTHFDTIPRNSNKRLKRGTKNPILLLHSVSFSLSDPKQWTMDCKTKNRQHSFDNREDTESVSIEILWNRVILVKIDRILLYFFVTCRFDVKQGCKHEIKRSIKLSPIWKRTRKLKNFVVFKKMNEYYIL